MPNVPFSSELVLTIQKILLENAVSKVNYFDCLKTVMDKLNRNKSISLN